MSSNWKKIGKKDGSDMTQHRHVRTATRNEEWTSVTDDKGKRIAHTLKNTSGNINVRIGIGTAEPFSRLSLGNNDNDGNVADAADLNKPGVNAAIAIHEKPAGTEFHGIAYNDRLNGLTYTTRASDGSTPDVTTSTTTGVVLMANKDTDVFRNDISGGIYIGANKIVTIGGPPVKIPCTPIEGEGSNTSVWGSITNDPVIINKIQGYTTNVTGNPPLRLHVKGGIQCDGYISFIRRADDDTPAEGQQYNMSSSAHGAAYTNDAFTGGEGSFVDNLQNNNVPVGSLWLSTMTGVGTGVEAGQIGVYYKKNSTDGAVRLAGTDEVIKAIQDISFIPWDGVASKKDDHPDAPSKRLIFKNATPIFNADWRNAHIDYNTDEFGSDSPPVNAGFLGERTEASGNWINEKLWYDDEKKLRNALTLLGGGVAICSRNLFNKPDPALGADNNKRWKNILCERVSNRFAEKLQEPYATQKDQNAGGGDVDAVLKNPHNIGGQLWIQKQLSIGPNMNRQIHYNEAFINIATGSEKPSNHGNATYETNSYDGSGVQRAGIPGIIIGGRMSRTRGDWYGGTGVYNENFFKIGGTDGKGPGASNSIILGCSGTALGAVYDCSNCIIMGGGKMGAGTNGTKIEAPNSIINGLDTDISGSHGAFLVFGEENTVKGAGTTIVFGKLNKVKCYDKWADNSKLVKGHGNFVLGYSNKLYNQIQGVDGGDLPRYLYPYTPPAPTDSPPTDGVAPPGYDNLNSIIGKNNTLEASEYSRIFGEKNEVYGTFANVYGSENNAGETTANKGQYVKHVTIYGEENTIRCPSNIKQYDSSSIQHVYIFGKNNYMDLSEIDLSNSDQNITQGNANQRLRDISNSSFFLFGNYANISMRNNSDTSNIRFAFGTRKQFLIRDPSKGAVRFSSDFPEHHRYFGNTGVHGNVFTIDKDGNVDVVGELSANSITDNILNIKGGDISYVKTIGAQDVSSVLFSQDYTTGKTLQIKEGNISHVQTLGAQDVSSVLFSQDYATGKTLQIGGGDISHVKTLGAQDVSSVLFSQQYGSEKTLRIGGGNISHVQTLGAQDVSSLLFSQEYGSGKTLQIGGGDISHVQRLYVQNISAIDISCINMDVQDICAVDISCVRISIGTGTVTIGENAAGKYQLLGLTEPLSLAQGGSGATNPGQARTNLDISSMTQVIAKITAATDAVNESILEVSANLAKFGSPPDSPPDFHPALSLGATVGPAVASGANWVGDDAALQVLDLNDLHSITTDALKLDATNQLLIQESNNNTTVITAATVETKYLKQAPGAAPVWDVLPNPPITNNSTTDFEDWNTAPTDQSHTSPNVTTWDISMDAGPYGGYIAATPMVTMLSLLGQTDTGTDLPAEGMLFNLAPAVDTGQQKIIMIGFSPNDYNPRIYSYLYNDGNEPVEGYFACTVDGDHAGRAPTDNWDGGAFPDATHDPFSAGENTHLAKAYYEFKPANTWRIGAHLHFIWLNDPCGQGKWWPFGHTYQALDDPCPIEFNKNS